MPSIAIPQVFVVCTAATATGVLTVASSTNLFPGAIGWLSLDDGSAQALIRITAQLSPTSVQVYRYAKDDINAAPGYGGSDMSAFNAAGHINLAPQAVPVNPAFSALIGI